MTENKSKEYAKLLREGRTSEATDLVSSSNSSKQVEEPVEQDEDEVEEEVDEPVSEVERFVELKGVGEELAEEMVQVFHLLKMQMLTVFPTLLVLEKVVQSPCWNR